MKKGAGGGVSGVLFLSTMRTSNNEIVEKVWIVV